MDVDCDEMIFLEKGERIRCVPDVAVASILFGPSTTFKKQKRKATTKPTQNTTATSKNNVVGF